MKMYRIGGSHGEIEEVEVGRATAHNVWVLHRGNMIKQKRNSKYYGVFYDLREQAIAHLHRNFLRDVRNAEISLSLARDELRSFENRYAIRS